MTDDRSQWTDQDFDSMSWHDNYVHGMSLVAGEYGAGQLILDIDFILEWLGCKTEGGYQFRIAPAELVFNNVIHLQFSLDYASMSATMGPFSIYGIDRRVEKRERYDATVWTVNISFPAGHISFESSGFRQTLRGKAIVSDEQFLTREQRQGALSEK